ncbi:MAG: hypothetical protein GYB67_07570 [Chloroflexi bacterium]|nr:hypothetical protein [Chloroflexota bacterium]
MDAWFRYRIYGLSIASTASLTGLTEAAYPGIVPDVQLRFAERHSIPGDFKTLLSGQWIPHPSYPPDNQPQVLFSPDDGAIGLRYRSGVDFVLAADGSKIWALRSPPLSHEYALVYLLNPVLGFALRLHQQACLHASGFLVDDHVVLLCGASGMGKSTTAGYFAGQGHTVITDDIAVIKNAANAHGNGFVVMPGYPLMRLYQKSAQAVVKTAGTLARIAPEWNKNYLNLQTDGYHFADTAAPLGVIYVIAGRAEEPRIEPLPPTHALMTLSQQGYPQMLLTAAWRADDFRFFAAVAAAIPVRRLILPDRFEQLPDLYEVLRADVANLMLSLPS